MTALSFRVLGPFEVVDNGRMLSAGGGKRRALLTVLLLSANHLVTIDRLIDALWADQPPRSALNLVQGYVSDWRHLLGAEPDRRAAGSNGARIASSRGGYRLVVEEDEFDLHRFQALAREGQTAAAAGDLDRAAQLLDRALAEWRGEALADFVDEPFHATAAAGLERTRVETLEALASLQLRSGRPEAALGTLQEAAVQHPLDERLTELRMLALYRTGRPAEALTVYESVRSGLADTLGANPGPDLQRVHLQILRQDDSLTAHASSTASLAQAATSPSAPTASAPTGLPLPVSTLVGRAAELETVEALLGAHRLVTLTGAGGSGKTRLALHAAAAMADHGDREVVFVDLAPVRDPARVVGAISEAAGVGVGKGPGAPQARWLATRLSQRRILLVLDNAEHVLEAAPEVGALLAATAEVRVLATSREPMGIVGETLYAVDPLPLPPRGEYDPQTVMASDAVRLFLDRTAAAATGSTIHPEDAPVLSAICRRLDGLPLALELAAPWLRTLSLGGLLEELDHALGLLTLGGGDRPERQRTLRAAIDWSYLRLSREQAALFDRFSVFRSGAHLEAIAAVADLGEDLLPALRGLVDRNLVVRSATTPPRYRMLETLREYASERLAERPDDEQSTRDRHARHFQHLAEAAARGSRSETASDHTDRLREEQDEIRAALEHLDRQGRHDTALGLATDALDLWWDLGHIREGFERISRALALASDDRSPVRTAAMTAAAFLVSSLGDASTALDLSRMAVARARSGDDRALLAAALWCRGGILQWRDHEAGRNLLEEAVTVARSAEELPARWGWAQRATVLAGAALSLSENLRSRDPARARALLEEGLDAVLAHSPYVASFLERDLGFLALDRGDHAGAEHWFSTSLDSAARVGSDRSVGRSHEALAALALAMSQFELAAHHAQTAIDIARDSGHVYNWAQAASIRARALLETGHVDDADTVLVEASEALGRTDPATQNKVLGPVRARVARLRGSPDTAAAVLAAAAADLSKDELRSENIVYLLECAALALVQGDSAKASRHLTDLEEQASRFGVVLADPDRHLLESLRQEVRERGQL